MRTDGDRESDNIEDRRGLPVSGPMAMGGGVVALIIGVIVWFVTGQPPQGFQSPGGGGGSPAAQTGGVPNSASEDNLTRFVRVVLADTEDVWRELFRQRGLTYRDPKLVLFTGQVRSACGSASASSGPFYCPGDERVYIDLAFYKELQDRYKSPGDFAQAYVIAHEVGHHVQKQLGTTAKVDAARQRMSETEYNKLSVRLELQADFYAGVWANHAQKMKKILEPGDLEEALRAANAIGDDTLQKRARGYVVPDSFTHGTSRQRMGWFKKGYQSGDISQGDTFNLPDP